MKTYRPNVVPLKTRVALIICVGLLIAFVLAELATGYTYLPGKRGGILLSGIPTLMIAFSAIALCIAAVLTIVDHYDRRPNEHSYKSIKTKCYKTALFLFLAAPIFEIAESLLLLGGIDVFPKFHGIAEKYTFYAPGLQEYARHLDPILANELIIVTATLAAVLIGYLLKKFAPRTTSRAVAVLAFICIFGLSFQWLAHTTHDFLTGSVKNGSRSYKYIVTAENEPAKFNAILLTHFSLGGIMFVASVFGLVGVATNRIKP